MRHVVYEPRWGSRKMEKNIEKYEHHGKVVNVQSHLKGRHREHCLCWQDCKYFVPEDRFHNCEIANANFKNCVKYDLVLPVWECPKYEKR